VEAEGEEVVDHLEAGVEEMAAEDHQVEEGHLEAQLVLDQDKQEEGPNWWAILPKYSMETAKGHNCSFSNGKFIGA